MVVNQRRGATAIAESTVITKVRPPSSVEKVPEPGEGSSPHLPRVAVVVRPPEEVMVPTEA